MQADLSIPIPAPSAMRAWGQGLLPWRRFALILFAWETLALLEALARYVDAGRAGHPLLLQSLLPTLMLQYLPLVVDSWVLSLLFARYRSTILRPAQLTLAFLLSLAVFLPVLTGVDVLIVLLREGRPVSDFSALLAAGGRITWWYNLFIVGLAFLGQAMIAFWWRFGHQQLEAQRAQTENLELRLGLLQGQLKPHFLFNALNSISALVRTTDGTGAAEALGKLGELLAYAHGAGQGRATSVADELEFVRLYFELQRLRYGERMDLVWHIETADWADLACPALLFQPLAENAVHHGVEPHLQRCRIDIGLALTDGNVVLRVANPVPVASRVGHGLGLNSVRERLAILYGERAILECESLNGSHVVHLHFPAHAKA